MNFDIFSLHPRVSEGIVDAGYLTPTDIQSKTIPAILAGRDMLGLAQTGTGKTAAFALPILHHLMNGRRGQPRALILSPTRELAEQTHSAFRALGSHTGLRSLTLYGGVSIVPQIKGLRSGMDILVACPGRLLDLVGQRAVDLRGITTLVLDEADQMFDMGFLPDIRRILAALPAVRQTMMFSATMPDAIRSLAMEILKNPVTVEIAIEKPVESIRHSVYAVGNESKYTTLLEVLPRSGGQALVFTRTKHRAKKLSDQLSKAGLSAVALQGNMSQPQRKIAMDSFRSGRVRVLVATDIAARGIDVAGISHVINYDMPSTAEAYTHRIGRTGRMDRAGSAMTLATFEDLPMLRNIERQLGVRIDRVKAGGQEPARPYARSAQPIGA